MRLYKCFHLSFIRFLPPLSIVLNLFSFPHRVNSWGGLAPDDHQEPRMTPKNWYVTPSENTKSTLRKHKKDQENIRENRGTQERTGERRGNTRENIRENISHIGSHPSPLVANFWLNGCWPGVNCWPGVLCIICQFFTWCTRWAEIVLLATYDQIRSYFTSCLAVARL